MESLVRRRRASDGKRRVRNFSIGRDRLEGWPTLTPALGSRAVLVKIQFDGRTALALLIYDSSNGGDGLFDRLLV